MKPDKKITFETDAAPQTHKPNPEPRGIARFIVKFGLAKNQQQATHILIIIIIFALFASVFLQLSQPNETAAPIVIPDGYVPS